MGGKQSSVRPQMRGALGERTQNARLGVWEAPLGMVTWVRGGTGSEKGDIRLRLQGESDVSSGVLIAWFSLWSAF